jgi:hypothetical protein
LCATCVLRTRAARTVGGGDWLGGHRDKSMGHGEEGVSARRRRRDTQRWRPHLSPPPSPSHQPRLLASHTHTISKRGVRGDLQAAASGERCLQVSGAGAAAPPPPGRRPARAYTHCARHRPNPTNASDAASPWHVGDRGVRVDFCHHTADTPEVGRCGGWVARTYFWRTVFKHSHCGGRRRLVVALARRRPAKVQPAHERRDPPPALLLHHTCTRPHIYTSTHTDTDVCA